MEFRLSVEGEPITEWERVSARDVDLWKASIRTNLNVAGSTRIDVESRKIEDRPGDDVAYAEGPPTLAMSKDELRTMADALGVDAPKGATKAQLLDLIREV